MAQVAKLIMQGSYWLGLLSVLLGVVARLAGDLTPLHLGPRGGLILAGTLFLCSIASHFVAEAAGKP